jgi:hypothetical protein
MGEDVDELKPEDVDKVTLDLASILDRVQMFHSENGQECMTRIIDSGQGDFNKWPIALVHSISMKFILDALGQQQNEINKLKTQLEDKLANAESKA